MEIKTTRSQELNKSQKLLLLAPLCDLVSVINTLTLTFLLVQSPSCFFEGSLIDVWRLLKKKRQEFINAVVSGVITKKKVFNGKFINNDYSVMILNNRGTENKCSTVSKQERKSDPANIWLPQPHFSDFLGLSHNTWQSFMSFTCPKNYINSVYKLTSQMAFCTRHTLEVFYQTWVCIFSSR